MFILNKTYLETAQTTLACSLPSVSRNCCLWMLVSLPPSMTFHPQPEVMQPFLVSSDTNFFYHPSTYFNSLEASCFLAKWFLLHKKQLLADLCGLLGSYSPSLMTSKRSSPCLHFLASSLSDTIELSQFFLKLPNFALGLLANLKQTCKVLVLWKCMLSWGYKYYKVVIGVMVVIPKNENWKLEIMRLKVGSKNEGPGGVLSSHDLVPGQLQDNHDLVPG